MVSVLEIVIHSNEDSVLSKKGVFKLGEVTSIHQKKIVDILQMLKNKEDGVYKEEDRYDITTLKGFQDFKYLLNDVIKDKYIVVTNRDRSDYTMIVNENPENLASILYELSKNRFEGNIKCCGLSEWVFPACVSIYDDNGEELIVINYDSGTIVT